VDIDTADKYSAENIEVADWSTSGIYGLVHKPASIKHIGSTRLAAVYSSSDFDPALRRKFGRFENISSVESGFNEIDIGQSLISERTEHGHRKHPARCTQVTIFR
jgi:hypothetical protein